jgi:hypothetical protein
MTARSRHVFGALAVAAGVAFGAGCAKEPTSVLVLVDAEDGVPPILIVRTSIAQAGAPDRRATSERTSNGAGDAGDRPGPYTFPIELYLTVDADFAGPVVITVEGLDWDTRSVTASGSATGVVEAHASTGAALTMTAAPVNRRDES